LEEQAQNTKRRAKNMNINLGFVQNIFNVFKVFIHACYFLIHTYYILIRDHVLCFSDNFALFISVCAIYIFACVFTFLNHAKGVSFPWLFWTS